MSANNEAYFVCSMQSYMTLRLTHTQLGMEVRFEGRGAESDVC